MNLFEAVKKGFLSEIEKCLARKEPVNMVDVSGFTPLHWAAITDNPYAIDILVRHGAKINEPATVLKVTPLHLAAVRNGQASVAKLLALGADPNVKNSKDDTALDIIFALNEKADFIGALAEFIPAVKLAEKTNYGFDALLELLARADTVVSDLKRFNDVVINAFIHDRPDVVEAARKRGFHYKQLQDDMTIFLGGLELPFEVAIGYDYALMLAMANASVACMRYLHEQDPDCYKPKIDTITGAVGRNPLIWGAQQFPDAVVFRAVQKFLALQEEKPLTLETCQDNLSYPLNQMKEDVSFGYDRANKRYYVSKVLYYLCGLYFDENGHPKGMEERLEKIHQMLQYLEDVHGIRVGDVDKADDYVAKFLVEYPLSIIQTFIGFGARFRGRDIQRAIRLQTPDVVLAMIPYSDVSWKNRDGEDAMQVLKTCNNDKLLDKMPELMRAIEVKYAQEVKEGGNEKQTQDLTDRLEALCLGEGGLNKQTSGSSLSATFLPGFERQRSASEEAAKDMSSKVVQVAQPPSGSGNNRQSL